MRTAAARTPSSQSDGEHDLPLHRGAKEWNKFAPKTLKQILIRSTNVLGLQPRSPKNLMRLTGEMICDNFQIIRCFDFLNHIDNMRPFAEVAFEPQGRGYFEPAIWRVGLTALTLLTTSAWPRTSFPCAAMWPASEKEVSRHIILGLKDMAGVCPPAS